MILSMEESIIKLKLSCFKSNGTEFENACENCLKLLKFGKVIGLGNRMGSFKRISDNVWIVEIENGQLSIIIENKAGNAISTLDAVKQKEDITNTLYYLNEVGIIKNMTGIWVWIIGGINVNSSKEKKTHGGIRGGKDLLTKLKEIYQFLKKKYSQYNYKIKVNAFSLDNFIHYFAYLHFTFTYHEIASPLNKDKISHFWDWSDIFKDPYSIFGEKCINFKKKLAK